MSTTYDTSRFLYVEFDSSIRYMDVPNHLGYRAGTDGSIWTRWGTGIGYRGCYLSDTWKLKDFKLDRKSYLRVYLNNKWRWVHQVILETFVGLKPDGMECRHYPDFNPLNNRLENISWSTHLTNMMDVRTQRMREFAIAEYDSIRSARLSGCSYREISKKFGISVRQVYTALGLTKK